MKTIKLASKDWELGRWVIEGFGADGNLSDEEMVRAMRALGWSDEAWITHLPSDAESSDAESSDAKDKAEPKNK